MISKFGLRDFKGHRDTQLVLGRFTMLVGDNASGKTSVLDALALQPGLGSAPAAVLRGSSSPKDILRRTSQGPIVFASEGIDRDLGWSATFMLHQIPKDSDLVKKSWHLAIASTIGGISLVAEAPTELVSMSRDWQRAWESIAAPLGTARVYRWRAERIAASAYSDQPGALIETDGTNTAVVLAAMKLGDDEVFNRVEDALRKLIPSIERLRLRPATVRRRSPNAGSVVGTKI